MDLDPDQEYHGLILKVVQGMMPERSVGMCLETLLLMLWSGLDQAETLNCSKVGWTSWKVFYEGGQLEVQPPLWMENLESVVFSVIHLNFL